MAVRAKSCLSKVSYAVSASRVPFTSSNGKTYGKNQSYKYAFSSVSYQEQRFNQLIAKSAPTTAEASAPGAIDPALVTSLDIRVGRIIKCERHPEADSLYVEEIDVGEAEPRTIVSGLVKYVPLEAMQDRNVIILANLKPRNMRGIKSNGMVLCASDAAHENVEPLTPPAGAAIGERVYFGEDGKNQPAAAEPNRVQKKKIWEEVQPHLKTDANKVAEFMGKTMLTSSGPVVAATLANGNIS